MMLRFHDDFYKFSCDPPYLSHQPFLRLLPSFPIARFFFVKASFTFRSPRLQRSRFVVRVPRGLSSAPLDVNFSLARNLLFIRQPRIIPPVAFLLRFLLGSFANVPSTSRSPVPFSILQTLPFVAPPPHFLHLFPPPRKQILPSFWNHHGRIAPRNFPFFVSKRRHEFSLPICRTLPFFTFSSPGFPFCRLNSFRFLSNPTFLSLFSQCPHLHAPHFRCKNQAFAATNKETVCLYLTIYIYFTLLK